MTRFAICLLAAALLLAASNVIAASGGTVSGDFTLSWRQMIDSAEQPTPVMTIGQTEVSIRPLPKDKPKDPASAALFIGDSTRSKTAIYLGKWYHFTLVGSGGKTRLYVNGFPDGAAIAEKLGGEVAMSGGARSMENIPRAMTDEQVLASFKALIQPREVATVAHRGIHRYAPENTRISYVQAIEAGAPIVEIDTALTRDGQIILMHDKTVDRTTDGTGKVAEMTLAEIRKLDAGSWKDPKYKGEPVPTIKDIDDVVRGKATIMFDLKAEGQGEAIAAWLSQSGFPKDQVILAPWTDDEGVALRKHVPDVPMIRLTGKLPTDNFDDAYFAQMRDKGFSGFSINWQNLSEAFVKAAHKNGMKVYVWTINDAPDIAGAVLLGVDGVVTDDSAATARTIAKVASNLMPQDVR
jgi:glycerophosphoryl diester phosphodiesterase